ncbi:MAG: hydroxymethylglutaryl-CoA lyase [Proteobacteria bacterium]|nr:hydroxymethylglutaryl-CoA lyase [Pseudomonadota bacterium]
MKPNPSRVNLCECWARDGLQGEAAFIPTQAKIDMIDRMTRAGFRRIEVTSFAHPKLIPQFGDGIEVLKGIERNPEATYIAIVPNDKGLDRLLDCCQAGYGVDEIMAILAASEDYLLAGLNRTMDEARAPLGDIVRRAHQAGLKVTGVIGTAFGCALAGEVPVERVEELAEWYLEQGADRIMLGDTTGEANPARVRRVYRRLRTRFPEVDFVAHFHDTRGLGLANTLAALEEGVVFHDGSLGGIGGQPATRRPKYHEGYSGNVCTEDLVFMLEEMGIRTGLDTESVIELGLEAERVLGRELLGHVTRSGPARRRSDRVLAASLLRPGLKIRPGLFLISPASSRSFDSEAALAEHMIRAALSKSWPLPEGLAVVISGLAGPESIPEREVVLTRFTVLSVDARQARADLECLSQTSDGGVFFQGRIGLLFPGPGGPAREENS